jgi:uncharacterized protein YrrD
MKWLILSKYFACENNYSNYWKKHSASNFEHVQSLKNKGTLITSNSNASGIKTLSVLENVFGKLRRKRVAR